MKPRWLPDVGATLTLAMWLPIAAKAATLSGTVKELGELVGVKGVTVVVLGPGEQELQTGTTAPDGTYRIDNLPLRIALKAVFDKLYYEERNKTVPVELTGDVMTMDVFLSKDSEDAAYNSRVAESLAKQAGAGDYRAFSLLTAASVRPSQRLALRRELEKRMQPQALELAIAKSVGDKTTFDTRMAATNSQELAQRHQAEIQAQQQQHQREQQQLEARHQVEQQAAQRPGDAHESVAGSWAGWITDEACGAKGAGAAHKACAEKCLEKGSKLVLYNSGDKKLYKLDKQDLAREHLGHQVTVKGNVEGDTIRVESISPKYDL